MANKSKKFWIILNSGIWFVAFVGLMFFMLINFASSTANMPPGGLEKIFKMLFDIYLPFLGIVTGSLFALTAAKNAVPRNFIYPLFVTAMVLFFNVFIITISIIFTITPDFLVDDFLALVKSFHRYISFFLAGLITHFNLFF